MTVVKNTGISLRNKKTEVHLKQIGNMECAHFATKV